jgi:sugar phosphate isomerase/epimerase
MTRYAANRRQFIQSLAAAAVAAAVRPACAEPPRRGTRLGFDNFSLRAFGYKAPQLIDYAASLKLDSLFISDLDAFENLDADYLAGLRRRAADAGLDIHVGTWSICPTSTVFRDNHGTAAEHLALGLRVAAAVGSPVLRVVLGHRGDRLTPGGIEARIADTVAVLRAARSQALELGVKIAVENHAGDMQAWELAGLIEQAGADFVGANLDSGNSTWTLEHPLRTLETLAPYVVTTSLRDSAVWETERGAAVQWTALGEGDVDQPAWFARFAELCPGVPVHIETISGFNHELPYLEPDFWQAFPKGRASELAEFVALARRGRPREPHVLPEGADRQQAEQEYQRAELERSLRYAKDVLGLGLK